MDTSLKLFKSFDFVDESNNRERLIFTTGGSTIQIDQNETVYIEDSKSFRVPTSDINAIACLAYLITPKVSRASLGRIESTEDLLKLVFNPVLTEQEVEYNDKLLEVFIKYQMLTKRNPDNTIDID